jgi:hypothetical protein
MNAMLELFWALVGKLTVDVRLHVFNTGVSLQVFSNEFILPFGYYK